MKVSKVVLIVVALHVLVIGGIFVFEGCSRATKAPTTEAENAPLDETAANAPALPAPQAVDATAPSGLTPANPQAATPVAATSTQPTAHTYVVKKGDSLWKIAKSQNVSIGDLSRANNLTKTAALKVGQKLQIPSTAKTEPATVASASTIPTPADASAPVPASTATSGADYMVKSGDSLWKIARQQNITVAALKQANSLTSDSLKIGQKLHIPTATASSAPSAPTAPVASAGIASSSPYSEWREPGTYNENGQTIHIVDVGESPANIAKKYGVKIEDLMKANNISDAKRIVVGQKLVIPIQPSAPAATPAAAVTAPIVSAKPAPAAN